jgi:hypothetical protein
MHSPEAHCHCQEERLLGGVDGLISSRTYERLQDEITKDPTLVRKCLEMIDYGRLKDTTADQDDITKPFHKNTTKFEKLTMKDLRHLFNAFHGETWGEQIVRKVRLLECRWLVCLALQVELSDNIPAKSMAALLPLVQNRYRQ